MEIQGDDCDTVRLYPDPGPDPGLRLLLSCWKKRLGQGGGGSRGAARTSRKKGKSIIKMEDDQGEASELQRGGGTLLPESKKNNLLARANRFLLKFSFKKLKAFRYPSKKQKLLPPTSIQVEKKSLLPDPETELVVLLQSLVLNLSLPQIMGQHLRSPSRSRSLRWSWNPQSQWRRPRSWLSRSL